MKNEACIIGVGQTELSSNSGRSVQRLAVEAITAALADANLPASAVDGIVPSPLGPTAEDIIASFGLADVRFTAVPHLGGAGAVASVRLAALAVAGGQADVVLAFVARNGRSGARVDQRVAAAMPGQQFRTNLEYPHGLSTPAQWYSLLCRRHMYEFGTTREQLGAVALTMRRHANLNPAAQMYRRPLTMAEYLASPVIADPYHLYDCCLETDGAAAVLVATSQYAARAGATPVRIEGAAEGHADSADDIGNRRDFFNTGLTKAAPRAFDMAGYGPEDMDFAMIYDCFTFEVIHQLESAGFCALGEGGAFVAGGNIALGGRLPVNPSGGLLSEGHLGGMNHLVEAVRQLRGSCGDRQVPGATRCAVTGWGDLGDGALAVLSTADA
ncbi:lipid-transfer protein [Actinoplanes sp. NBRC 103695]|uniref:thiolase C-terminal domain-containing protein n=1 Tax=Actinoplanes sp. NBRC 103695 TaxID=3032202 RepID=UPI0024A32F8D|nr:lipid-transfer protein [Actinoplanes sp. NBRC 103695]GLY97212.1 lipid-transfer protein [Actinoplanes sp. NBRC 103695]